MPYGLPDGSHTRMKVKKTYRLEQETIEELEKLCSDSGKSATEVIEGAIHDAIHVPDVERHRRWVGADGGRAHGSARR